MKIPDHLFKSIEAGTLAYRYRGIRCVKNPIDLAIMSRLLWDVKPRTIIEVGTMDGGSALWMYDQMKSYGVPCSVHSVDLSPPVMVLQNDGVYFRRGDARDLGATFSWDFMSGCQRPLMMVEDADHRAATTAAVLEFFDCWSRPGEYVVVEDGDAEDYYPGAFGGGPRVAIESFLKARSSDYEVDRRYCDMFGLTFFPEGYIRRKSQ